MGFLDKAIEFPQFRASFGKSKEMISLRKPLKSIVSRVKRELMAGRLRHPSRELQPTEKLTVCKIVCCVFL